MALMLGKLYDALIAAGVPPDKAQAASEEVAAHDSRLSHIRTQLRVLTWMNAMLMVLILVVLYSTLAAPSKQDEPDAQETRTGGPAVHPAVAAH